MRNVQLCLFAIPLQIIAVVNQVLLILVIIIIIIMILIIIF